MPSRFHGINAILAAVAVFVAIAGSIVGILVAIGVIGENEPVPEVESIAGSKPEVASGQPVDVLGKNLNLVSDVLLTSGTDFSTNVVFFPVNESRLVIVIPIEIVPGEYFLEFRTKGGDTIATRRTQVVNPSAPPTATPVPTPSPTAFPAPAITPTPTSPPKPTPTPTAAPNPTPTSPLEPTPTPTDAPTPTSTPRPIPTSTVPTATIRPPPLDDHGNDIPSATSIPTNRSLIGDIEVEGDIDFFSFEALKDTRYVIGTFTSSSGSLKDPFIQLFDSKESKLASKDDEIMWTAPSSGTFFFAVSARDSSHTGKYSVSVSIDTP